MEKEKKDNYKVRFAAVVIGTLRVDIIFCREIKSEFFICRVNLSHIYNRY